MIAATLTVKIAAQTAEFHRAMQESQRAVQGTAQQMEQASAAVTALQTRMRTLSESYRIGRISEAEYAQGLQTLRADVAELGTQTDLTSNSQARLAQVGGQAARQLNLLSAQARRNKDGFEAIGTALEGVTAVAVGGVGALSGVLNRLSIMARGNPVLIGILGGLAAVASAWALISSKAKDAADRVADFSRLRLAQRGITGAQTQEQIAAEIAARERQLAATRTVTTAPRQVGEFMVPGQTMTVPVVQGERRAVLEEELGNLRVIQTLNQRRIETEHGVTTEVTNQATALVQVRNLLRDIDQMKPQPMAGPTASFTASIEQQKAAVQAAANAGLAAAQAGAAGGLGGQTTVDRLRATLQPVLDTAKDFAAQMIDVANPIAAGIVAIAQGAAQGFANFGQILRGVLGGLLQTVGQSMIAFGVAGLAIKNFIKNPVTALVAGAALVALGSALAGSAARSVSAAGSALGGGGGSSSAVAAGGESGNFTTVRQNVTETGTPVTSPRPAAAPDVNLTVQIMAQDGRVVAQYVTQRSARELALGARQPGQSAVERVAVQGLAVVAGV